MCFCVSGEDRVLYRLDSFDSVPPSLHQGSGINAQPAPQIPHFRRSASVSKIRRPVFTMSYGSPRPRRLRPNDPFLVMQRELDRVKYDPWGQCPVRSTQLSVAEAHRQLLPPCMSFDEEEHRAAYEQQRNR